MLIFIKMKKNLERIIEIPEGIDVKVDGDVVSFCGNSKEISKKFNFSGIKISIEGKNVKLTSKDATRRESKMIGTIWANINNMIGGINEDFVYKLEICNVHFPMNVKVEGDNVVIKSFLGETVSRNAKIMKDTKVEVKGNQITVSSHNRENAGQTAANIEKATRLSGRDRRIFQDGIFITEKCGRGV